MLGCRTQPSAVGWLEDGEPWGPLLFCAGGFGSFASFEPNFALSGWGRIPSADAVYGLDHRAKRPGSTGTAALSWVETFQRGAMIS